MSDTDYDYSEAWDLYADEEKPWTDLERLLRLDDQMSNQMEMGDALGCSPSTISTWLQKAKESRDVTLGPETRECVYHAVCGNETANKQTLICDSCLDLVRTADREAGPNLEEAADRESFIKQAYDHYDITP